MPFRNTFFNDPLVAATFRIHPTTLQALRNAQDATGLSISEILHLCAFQSSLRPFIPGKPSVDTARAEGCVDRLKQASSEAHAANRAAEAAPGLGAPSSWPGGRPSAASRQDLAGEEDQTIEGVAE